MTTTPQGYSVQSTSTPPSAPVVPPAVLPTPPLSQPPTPDQRSTEAIDCDTLARRAGKR
jgi:hypothetical protein